MSPRNGLMVLALLLPLGACAPKPEVAAPPASASAASASACDRQCLYGVLDAYLTALKAHDVKAARLAPNARYTENNVELAPGDGLWGTITALDSYEMRFADAKDGQVGIFGVVEETTTKSPYATRLKVVNGAITEVETIVVRKDDAGIPFVTADIKPVPVWSELVPEAERDSRETLIAAADGYFNTLELNDGTLRVQFTDDCNRREDGMQSTNLKDPGLDPIWRMGCADQFRQGAYRYDDRIRARRYMVVDQELGIVLSAGFIDHEGRLGKFKLADGTERESIFRRPNTLAFLEAFKVKKGAIRQVESVFLVVPYRMPSPWGP
jgi:hypothetical protein